MSDAPPLTIEQGERTVEIEFRVHVALSEADFIETEIRHGDRMLPGRVIGATLRWYWAERTDAPSGWVFDRHNSRVKVQRRVLAGFGAPITRSWGHEPPRLAARVEALTPRQTPTVTWRV